MSGVNGQGSAAGNAGPAGVQGGPEVDPSMEDILASIRRILSEDETLVDKPATGGDEVFNLDESMLVAAPRHLAAKAAQAEAAAPELPPAAPQFAEPAITPEIPMMSGNGDARMTSGLGNDAMPAGDLPANHGAPMGPLVAPEATDAVSASMGNLMRSLATERQMSVYRGGPTLEDMVRDEMRPMLKAWLDTNLPPMVERIVRAEIERVAQRAAG